MQDLRDEALGDVRQGDLSVRCIECAGVVIHTVFRWETNGTLASVRIFCPRCGGRADFPVPPPFRQSDVSAGIHESVAQAPEAEEVKQAPSIPKRSHGLPRKRGGAKPWVAEGISRSYWYRKRGKNK
jgi:hypothetical protein